MPCGMKSCASEPGTRIANFKTYHAEMRSRAPDVTKGDFTVYLPPCSVDSTVTTSLLSACICIHLRLIIPYSSAARRCCVFSYPWHTLVTIGKTSPITEVVFNQHEEMPSATRRSQELGCHSFRLFQSVQSAVQSTVHSRMPPEKSFCSSTSTRSPLVFTGVKETSLNVSLATP